MIAITIPHLKLTSRSNARVHWAVRAKEDSIVNTTVGIELRRAFRSKPPPKFPCRVVMTRIGPRPLDSDNLAGSLKAVRDAVAEFAGMDDRDSIGWQWDTKQLTGKYAVVIEFMPLSEDPDTPSRWYRNCPTCSGFGSECPDCEGRGFRP